MAEIVGKRERLGEILVEAQRAGKRPGNLRHFEAVGEARTIVISFMINEDLGLVVEPPEGRGMEDTVAVAGIRRARVAWGLGLKAPAACARIDGVRGAGRGCLRRKVAACRPCRESPLGLASVVD
jgi:hypothetical protein